MPGFPTINLKPKTHCDSLNIPGSLKRVYHHFAMDTGLTALDVGKIHGSGKAQLNQ